MHTVLSPCADELMTPNNILNMAMLNELDFIAITDHNSTKQLHNVKQLSESYDFIIIPAVEVSVAEGFDCLCYFRTYEDAHSLDQLLEMNLTDNWLNYTKDDQVITDIYDMSMDTFDKPLTSTTINYLDLHKEVKNRNGAIIIAHINRPSCTPLNTYKLEEIPFEGLEVSPYNMEDFIKKHPNIKNYPLFHNSDSHSLLQMHDKQFSIELKEKSIEAFFNYLEGD